jgi:hypothetical protein
MNKQANVWDKYCTVLRTSVKISLNRELQIHINILQTTYKLNLSGYSGLIWSFCILCAHSIYFAPLKFITTLAHQKKEEYFYEMSIQLRLNPCFQFCALENTPSGMNVTRDKGNITQCRHIHFNADSIPQANTGSVVRRNIPVSVFIEK